MPLLPVSHQEQLHESDCLAACAASVLRYIGVTADYDELLSLLQIGEFGASYRNLQYLEELGVQVLLERGEVQNLRDWLARDVPPIVFLNTGELWYWNEATGHAVVVVGIEGNEIYVNDPAFADAPKKILVDEFVLAWMDMRQFYGVIETEE